MVTGGPGSGKTSLIESFQEMNYTCFPEVSRAITTEAQKQGVSQLFLENPILFSEKLLKGRLQQFNDAHKLINLQTVFFDRGLPDVIAYLNFKNVEYPDSFIKTTKKNRYDKVFILPPWEEIYVNDNERYESFNMATLIYRALEKTYVNFGYSPIIIKPGTLKERTQQILNCLSE